MKKLMIAAAIVCAAALSHAASSQWQDWTITKKSFKMSDGTNPDNTLVYLMDTKAATWDALKTILTDGSADYANLAAVLAGDDFKGAKVDSHTTYTDSNKSKVGQYYGQITDGKFGFAEDVVDTVSSTYAILITDGEKYLVSGELTGVSYSDDPNAGVATAFGSTHFSTEGSISGGWQTYTSAVPEPTSGLLLLLGVAGLALRRRRA